MLQRVCDRAMQAHGAMGICQDSFLPLAWIGARCLRFADGPDEVHWRKAAELELKAQKDSPLRKFVKMTSALLKTILSQRNYKL